MHDRTNVQTDTPVYLTVTEVAEHLRLSRMTIYRMVADGEFPGTLHTGRQGRTIRIPHGALAAHMAIATQAPAPQHIAGQTEIS